MKFRILTTLAIFGLTLPVFGFPENLLARTDAEAYFCRGYNTNSILDLSQALRLNPRYSDAYLVRGNIQFHSSDYRSAIANYNQILRIQPNYSNRAAVFFNRGNAHFQTKNYRAAIQDLTSFIRISPYISSNAYTVRGTAYLILGSKQLAIADYQKAAAASPNSNEHIELIERIQAIRSGNARSFRESPVLTEGKLETTCF